MEDNGSTHISVSLQMFLLWTIDPSPTRSTLDNHLPQLDVRYPHTSPTSSGSTPHVSTLSPHYPQTIRPSITALPLNVLRFFLTVTRCFCGRFRAEYFTHTCSVWCNTTYVIMSQRFLAGIDRFSNSAFCGRSPV